MAFAIRCGEDAAGEELKSLRPEDAKVYDGHKWVALDLSKAHEVNPYKSQGQSRYGLIAYTPERIGIAKPEVVQELTKLGFPYTHKQLCIQAFFASSAMQPPALISATSPQASTNSICAGSPCQSEKRGDAPCTNETALAANVCEHGSAATTMDVDGGAPPTAAASGSMPDEGNPPRPSQAFPLDSGQHIRYESSAG